MLNEPIDCLNPSCDCPCHTQKRMSLRDWFAGQALLLLSRKGWWDKVVPSVEFVALNAYRIADEMLKARDAQS
jgi:hypothetical protein